VTCLHLYINVYFPLSSCLNHKQSCGPISLFPLSSLHSSSKISSCPFSSPLLQFPYQSPSCPLPHVTVPSDRRKIIYEAFDWHRAGVISALCSSPSIYTERRWPHMLALQGARGGRGGGGVKHKPSSPESKTGSSAFNLHFISCTDCHLLGV